MGTVTVSSAGFANTPAQPPANWPPTITYPANSVSNGSHTYTISDADWQRLLTWTAASQFAPGSAPTAGQILLALVQVWWKGAQQAEQVYSTSPPPVPPPVTITP